MQSYRMSAAYLGADAMPSRSTGRKIVILVERDADSREHHQRALVESGYEVLCFPDYVGALNEAESDRRLDLLITEIHLPAGTPHGLALAAMMQLRRPLLRVMFVTDTQDLSRLADERSSILLRPFPASRLVEAVDGLIGKPDIV